MIRKNPEEIEKEAIEKKSVKRIKTKGLAGAIAPERTDRSWSLR